MKAKARRRHDPLPAPPAGGGPVVPPAPIRVEEDTCRDPGRSSALEWLETNGTGTFAMGTVSGVHTRRYHGHLVASPLPGRTRHVLLSKLEETVLAAGQEVQLGANQYPGALHPQGFRHLSTFDVDPYPTWTFDAAGLRVVRSLLLVPGEPSVLVRWTASAPCRLRVEPFLAHRDYHALRREGDPEPAAEIREGTVRLGLPDGLPDLHLHHSPGAFTPGPVWYRNTEYLLELERGLDFREDLFRPGSFELELGPGRPAHLLATLAPRPPLDRAAAEAIAAEVAAGRAPRAAGAFQARLSRAADPFLARRADGSLTVIAGYPWFTDWGRDTMIALPGLLVARGRLAEARQVMERFLSRLDRGVLPNRFGEEGEQPEYNTVDATLWLFQAAQRWLDAGGEPAFLETLYPAGLEVLSWHRRGTHHGIRVDPADGLLSAGGPGTQLTWMDAKVGDQVVTPRHGKPVEVNALWHSALLLMSGWARALGRPAEAEEHGAAAARVAASFDRAFWNPARGHLHDVILPEGPDPRLRPNQLFALSLRHLLLDPPRRRAVLEAVERHLLTPVGLRTLAPGEPGYRAHYRGGPAERDGAYHQGTVWPWLLGPFVRATLAVRGRSPKVVARCRHLLDGLERHLGEACLGTISEIFDADPPHLPAGAPAQAWSVAELLHLLRVELAEGSPPG